MKSAKDIQFEYLISEWSIWIVVHFNILMFQKDIPEIPHQNVQIPYFE